MENFKIQISSDLESFKDYRMTSGTSPSMPFYLQLNRIFVVLDFGNLGNKIDEIEAIRRERISHGECASTIVVIDATKKLSASKRK